MNFIGLPFSFVAAGGLSEPSTLNSFFLMVTAALALISSIVSLFNTRRIERVKGEVQVVNGEVQKIHVLINSRFDEWRVETKKAAHEEGAKAGMAAGIAQEVARAQGLAVGVLTPVPGSTADTPEGLAAGAKGLAAGAEGLAAGAQGLKAGAEGLAAGAKRSGEPKP